MERTTEQIRKDLSNGKFDFSKSKELAPVGFKFQTNYDLENEKTHEDVRDIKWLCSNGYIVIPKAFNMYGEVIKGIMAVYRKIEED